MKIVTTKANPYHTVGSEIEMNDEQAQVLIDKGFAKVIETEKKEGLKNLNKNPKK